MAYHKCITGNNSGGATETLLWTNPSPTAALGAQTLSLGLTDYDYVKIVVRYGNANATEKTRIIKRKNMTDYDGITTTPGFRFFQIDNDSLIWTTGFTAAWAQNGNYNIPIRVYGITGFLQEPY